MSSMAFGITKQDYTYASMPPFYTGDAKIVGVEERFVFE